jgi:hypothetical protein
MRAALLPFLAILGASVVSDAPRAIAGPAMTGPDIPPTRGIAAILLQTDVFVAAIPEAVAADLARRIYRVEKLTSRLADDEGFLRSADEGTLLLLFNRTEGKAELMRGYAPSFGATPPPVDLFHHLDAALDLLWQEIDRLAPTYASSTGHPLMGSIATALERRLRVTVPKATYVGGMLREKEWRVRLSALGLPESRAMAGVLFYRIPDQAWVICREFEVSQRYFKRDAAEGPCEITFGCMRLQERA